MNKSKKNIIFPFLIIITGYIFHVNYFIIVPGALLLVLEAVKIFKKLKLKDN